MGNSVSTGAGQRPPGLRAAARTPQDRVDRGESSKTTLGGPLITRSVDE